MALISKIDFQASILLLKRPDPKPTLGLQKVAKFVVRTVWGPSMATTLALSQPDCIDKLTQWLSEAKAASPLFGMTKAERGTLSNILQRALVDIAADQAELEAFKEPQKRLTPKPGKAKAAGGGGGGDHMGGDEPAVETLEASFEAALRSWCRSIYGLLHWPGLDSFSEDLVTYNKVSALLEGAEATAREMEAIGVSIKHELETNCDPYDPRPEGEKDAAGSYTPLPVSERDDIWSTLDAFPNETLIDLAYATMDSNGGGSLSQKEVHNSPFGDSLAKVWKELDTDGDIVVSKMEWMNWFTKLESLLGKELVRCFVVDMMWNADVVPTPAVVPAPAN